MKKILNTVVNIARFSFIAIFLVFLSIIAIHYKPGKIAAANTDQQTNVVQVAQNK